MATTKRPDVGGNTIMPATKLHFVLSARDLPRKERDCVGATVQDPYVKVSYRSSTLKEWAHLASTDFMLNNMNPDWNTVFSFDWTKGSGQLWRFEVLDKDVLSKDDIIGGVDVNVDNYVLEKKEELALKLGSGGALFIKKASPVTFTLSADDIPKLDPLQGLSDPFVECFWSHGKDGPLSLFAKTKIVKNVESASWEKIEFPNYQRGTNQYWTFKVYDYDTLPKNDVVGEAAMDIDAFLKKRSGEVLKLSKCSSNQATLTVTLASLP